MECNHQAQMLFFLDIEVLLRTLIKIIAMSEFILTIRVQVAGAGKTSKYAMKRILPLQNSCMGIS